MGKLLNLYIKDKKEMYEPIKFAINKVAYRSAILFLDHTPVTVGNMLTAWTIYSVVPLVSNGEFSDDVKTYRSNYPNVMEGYTIQSLTSLAKNSLKDDVNTELNTRKLTDNIVITNNASVGNGEVYADEAIENSYGKNRKVESTGMDMAFDLVTSDFLKSKQV